jgi:UPF0176 protein
MAKFLIINSYKFMPLGGATELQELKQRLNAALVEHSVYGTILLASEGFNASLCGLPEDVKTLLPELGSILSTSVEAKGSFHDESPFRKQEVRIKPEIVTLKKDVDMALGSGTHVPPSEWNSLISDPEVLVLDTRNDYEFRTGSFRNAVNPETTKFSELPGFVERRLDPAVHKKVAMFCTGGIRCEKFAPYLRSKGFEEVYQLEGGILKYLEQVPENEQLWEGECFVFDERIALNSKLEKGEGVDLSQRHRTSTSEGEIQ